VPQHPFEVGADDLASHIDEMVDVTFADIQSQFLMMPRGQNFIEFVSFQDAYEALKQETDSFARFTDATVWQALQRNALVFMVVRTILGVSPPEWAELAKSERDVDVPQNVARQLDTRCRSEAGYFARDLSALSRSRIEALVSVAVEYITRGAPPGAIDAVHRLNKVDTAEGLTSLRHASSHHVPYAVLLYERYLGRPFASHRDSVSELVGDVMESAIEELLTRARLTFRKTKRAERVPSFDQAPDFFVPTEVSPAAIIEAKITGDDGTARDKVSRVLNLATMRDNRERAGQPTFELIACIDGRGFRVRREDMRKMLLATRGKVFTLVTLNQLIEHTRLREFLPRPS
jgi:hypothetical protein